VRKVTHARKRNAWADRDELLNRCRGPWRNHVCGFALRSVTGFGRGGGSNFGFLHWLASSLLQHSRTTVRVCDLWLTMSHRSVLVTAWTTDNRWPPAVCAGRSSMALFTRTAKLDPGAHGARCTWAMTVHHAVGISRHRYSGYKPSRVSIMHKVSPLPIPPLALYIAL